MKKTTTKKVFLITGCASGIGKELACQLAKEGHLITATDIDIRGLHDAYREFGWNSDQVLIRRLDITNHADWKNKVSQTIKKWGRIDVLINAAAYIKPSFCYDSTPLEISRQVDTNVKGVMLGTLAVSNEMKKIGSGHIINLSSMAGVAPIPGISHYTATKFAIRGFSLASAQELRPWGIYVTVVCPGAVRTPLLEKQSDIDAAAMMFTGSSIMNVDKIVKIIINKVIKKKPLEVLVPRGMSITAKFISVFPSLILLLSERMMQKGKRHQKIAKEIVFKN